MGKARVHKNPFDFSDLESDEPLSVVCQGKVLGGQILVAYPSCFACYIQENGKRKLMIFDAKSGKCVEPEEGAAFAVRVKVGANKAERAKILSMLKKHQKEVGDASK